MPDREGRDQPFAERIIEREEKDADQHQADAGKRAVFGGRGRHFDAAYSTSPVSVPAKARPLALTLNLRENAANKFKGGLPCPTISINSSPTAAPTSRAIPVRPDANRCAPISKSF